MTSFYVFKSTKKAQRLFDKREKLKKEFEYLIYEARNYSDYGLSDSWTDKIRTKQKINKIMAHATEKLYELYDMG